MSQRQVLASYLSEFDHFFFYSLAFVWRFYFHYKRCFIQSNLGIFGGRHVKFLFLWRRGRKRQERLASTCVLCSNDSQALASWKKLAVKFEQAQICRKLTQVIASHRKLAVKRDTTKHKQKLAMTCVLVWSGLKRERVNVLVNKCFIGDRSSFQDWLVEVFNESKINLMSKLPGRNNDF